MAPCEPFRVWRPYGNGMLGPRDETVPSCAADEAAMTTELRILRPYFLESITVSCLASAKRAHACPLQAAIAPLSCGEHDRRSRSSDLSRPRLFCAHRRLCARVARFRTRAFSPFAVGNDGAGDPSYWPWARRDLFHGELLRRLELLAHQRIFFGHGRHNECHFIVEGLPAPHNQLLTVWHCGGVPALALWTALHVAM